MSEVLLENFLSIAASELQDSGPKRHLKQTEIFSKDGSNATITPTKIKNVTANTVSSIIHTGDTDSSDDEDNKYYEDQKYNECGKDIKHLLESKPSTSCNFVPQSTVTWKNKVAAQNIELNKKCTKEDLYTDPVFGLRIVNPLVSSASLKAKMVGREAVMFSRINKFITRNVSDCNWVIGGVIVGKSPVKTSQKGNQFLIWTLSDLKDDIKTISVLLFGSAYKNLWKTAVGTIVGILNATVLEKKEGSKDEATLSIDNPQKVMIIGQSKDLGTCKSVKKNGEPCTAIVNVNRCEYCIYHIKQEYQKCSRRSELQSNFVGKGLTALRNKVLGKNEVFYAGKSYTAIPAKRSKKMEEKDHNRLQALTGTSEIMGKKIKKKTSSKAAANIELTYRQRMRDLTLLQKLGGGETKSTFEASHSTAVTLESSKQTAVDIISKLKAKTTDICALPGEMNELPPKIVPQNNTKCIDKKLLVTNSPSLSEGEKGIIDLGRKTTSKQIARAKLTALKYIQKNGPLKKVDPNSVKKAPSSSKRLMENMDNQENPSKKYKKTDSEFVSDRFKKIMEATSKHLDLLDERDNEEQEKYFHKLEVKEKMEEKMINTYKVPCKAVQCLKCKYTNFSASQFCKDNKHALKVFDAIKRFFKCGNCGNRIHSLEIVPTTLCKNCGSGKWERTGMMKEKTAEVAHKLSIRGGEQTFINSVVTDGNLNLLVPEVL